MDSYLSYIGISEADLRWIFESQLYRQKVIEAITADVSKEADQVWTRQIVVADEETAKQVVERLDAGENFAALAAELSTDEATKSIGGDLGWIGAGTLDQTVEKVVFNLSIGQTTEPIQTTTGWYIVQLLGHEVRPIPDTDYQQLVQLTYNDWLTTTRAAAQVDINDIWLERTPTSPSIPASMQLSNQ
jgi:foldase protein PrsA